MKFIYTILIFFYFSSCNSKTEVKEKTVSKTFVEILNDSLYDKVDISKFLDSITNQKIIKEIGTFKEEFNPNTREYTYTLYDLKYKLKVFDIDKELGTNTIFYDGINKISFKDNKILSFNDEEYKTEDFGFNYHNTLRELKLIKINESEFLYGDISQECVGIGCGCRLTFIYDIKTKKAFFQDNYRFPFDKFLISDFNNDNIIDLLVVSRNKNRTLKGLPCEQVAFKTTWFEYKNGSFIVKPSYRDERKETSLEFYSYSNDFNHDETKIFWAKEDSKWEHYK